MLYRLDLPVKRTGAQCVVCNTAMELGVLKPAAQRRRVARECDFEREGFIFHGLFLKWLAYNCIIGTELQGSKVLF